MKIVSRVVKGDLIDYVCSWGTDETFLNISGKDILFSALCHFFRIFFYRQSVPPSLS